MSPADLLRRAAVLVETVAAAAAPAPWTAHLMEKLHPNIAQENSHG
jgi:hypothetical protein